MNATPAGRTKAENSEDGSTRPGDAYAGAADRIVTPAHVWARSKHVPRFTRRPSLSINANVSYAPCFIVDFELALADRGPADIGPQSHLQHLLRQVPGARRDFLALLDDNAFSCGAQWESFWAPTAVELADGAVTGLVVTFLETPSQKGPACDRGEEGSELFQRVGSIDVPSGHLVVTSPEALIPLPCRPVPEHGAGAPLFKPVNGVCPSFQLRLPGPGHVDLEVQYVVYNDEDHAHAASIRAQYRGYDE